MATKLNRYLASSVLIFNLLFISLSSLANDKVTLQLKWTHQFQFAGYYAAKAQGFYQKSGLDVEILAAAPEVNSTEAIISGEANYAVGSSSVLLDRLAGKPIVVLAVIFQHSPYTIISKANKNINSVHDLIGKKIMLEPQADELIAYLKREGISLTSVNRIPHTFDLNSLISDETDAYSAYVTSELFTLNQAGIPYLTFTPRSAGIDFYGDNLFTSEQELAENPERAEAFIQASLKGWQYAMDHQEEIVELILSEYSTKLSHDALIFEAKKMEELLFPDLIELGYMYQGRWQHIAETYAELGLIPKDYSLSGFIYQNNSNKDFSKLYWTLFFAVIIILTTTFIAWRFYRLSKTLKSLLYFKNRLSNVGEAVGNISHQWKQPLNKIVFQLMRMEQSIISKNNIDKKELLILIANSHKTLQFMADTSDTFNDFFSDNKEKTQIYPAEIITSTLALLNDTFNNHQIIVTHTSDNKIVLNGNQNEFSNIMLSILNNAKEVFVKRETSYPKILISMERNAENFVVIMISDNAGGIIQKPISSIFNYGSSTGHDHKSNGLGLFIAKELIQNKFNGDIYVENNKQGARFKIKIPILHS
jgi:ABC-type nitrate/sulfonate/bicarbonate transport system substrate-binding protein